MDTLKQCDDPLSVGCVSHIGLRTFTQKSITKFHGCCESLKPGSVVCQNCCIKLLSKQKEIQSKLFKKLTCCNPSGKSDTKHSNVLRVVTKGVTKRFKVLVNLKENSHICIWCHLRLYQDRECASRAESSRGVKAVSSRGVKAMPSRAVKPVSSKLSFATKNHPEPMDNDCPRAPATENVPSEISFEAEPEPMDLEICISQRYNDAESNDDRSDHESETPTEEEDNDENCDPTVSYTDEIKTKTLDSVNLCFSALGLQPLDSLAVDDIRPKLKEAILSLKSKLEVIAGTKFYSTDTCNTCQELVQDAALAFKSSTKDFKYVMLSTIPQDLPKLRVSNQFGCTRRLITKAKKLRSKKGPFAFHLNTRESLRKFSKRRVNLIQSFYRHPQNSRSLAGMQDTLLVKIAGKEKKERVGKYRLLTTIPDLHQEFCLLFPNEPVSLSKFQELRPKEVIPIGNRLYHNTCTCIYHENFGLMLDIFGDEISLNSVLETVPCDRTSEKCMFGLCPDCPKANAIEKMTEKLKNTDTVVYYQWTQSDRTQKIKVTETKAEFCSTFESTLPNFLKHHFLVHQQNLFVDYWHDITTAQDRKNEVLITVDFAQNFNFIYQDEVQSAHWSHNQATLHPMVIEYFQETVNEQTGEQSFEIKTYEIVVISDDLLHNTVAFHAFLTEAMKIIKNIIPHMKTVRYISDGSAAQYKNWKNILNLMYHEKDFGCQATLEFYPTAHGKGSCDRLSGNIKRITRTENVAKAKNKNLITNPQEMFEFWIARDRQKQVQNRTFIYVSHEDVSIHYNKVLKARYQKGRTISGTKSFHSISKISKYQCEVKSYSLQESSRVISLEKLMPQKYSCGQYVIAKVGNSYAVGIIKEMQLNEITMEFFKIKRTRRNLQLTWPTYSTEHTVLVEDVVCTVSKPNSRKGSSTFQLNCDDTTLLIELIGKL